MKNTNVKKAVLPQFLIFAAAVILTLAAWGFGKLQTPESLVSYSYEDRKLPEDMLSIIHEAGLVPVNARLEGSYFCPEADDAQLIVSVEPEQTGAVRCIEFDFQEPFESDTAYTLFYPGEDGAFSEKSTLSGTIRPGKDSLFLELPKEAGTDMQFFRLDIDEEYHLEDIRVSPSETTGTYIPADHRDGRLLTALFLTDLLLLEMIWFLGKGFRGLWQRKEKRPDGPTVSLKKDQSGGWYLFGVLLLAALILFEWKNALVSQPSLSRFAVLFPAVTGLVLILAFFFRKNVLCREDDSVSWWKLYVSVTLILAVLYMIVFLPFLSPDEKTHYLSAYRIADWFLGKGTPARNSRMIIRLEDHIFVSMRHVGLSAEYLRELSGQAHLLCRENGFVVRDAALATNAILCYFPAALGIAAARVLHLSGMAAFYMSRGAGILFCTGVMAHVMKKYRTANDSLFSLMCFPMMLQLIASCTYDAVAFCNILLFVSQVLYIKNSLGKVPGRELILCMLYAALLGPSKTVYLPLLFLIFLVPGEKLGDSRQRRVWIRISVIASGVLSLLLVSSVLRWLSSSTAVQTMIAENAGGHILSWNGEEGYTFSYILQNLKDFIMLCARTLTQVGDEYFFTMLGSRLARYELTVPAVCGTVCFVLFLLSSNIRKDREEAEDFVGWQKVWCLLLCAGCVFCIMLALTLGWTPLSSDVILGIQGRYFLPLLPVLIPVIRDRHIRVDTGLRRRMVFLTTAVNLWLLVHAYSQMFFTA